MAKKLQELSLEISQKSNRVNELFDAADKRGDGVNTQAEIDEIKSLNKELEDLEKEATEVKGMEDIRRGNDDRIKTLSTPVGQIPFPGDGASQQPFKSFGQLVMDDPAMQEYLKRFAKGFGTATQTRIDSPKVDVKTLITGSSSTSAGPLVGVDRKPIVDTFYQRPLTVRDLITIGETGTDTVEYARMTSVTNAAAPVAEATATGDGTGAKPESSMTFALITESVKTIAHWVAASNRAMADAGQLRTYIDNFLRYGVDEELEDQILTGNAAGQNFDGVLHVTGTTAQAFSSNVLTTTRKARTKVRTTGRAKPTAFVMHPNDWEAIDLLQDNEARYYYGGPMNPGQPRLWGLPVVESEGMTEGFTVVADWKLAVLWDRMETMISMTNSHSDFFVRNLIAILAEMRAAFGIIRPAAFVIADLTA